MPIFVEKLHEMKTTFIMIAAFAAILFLFALFTVAPPHLPLFQDSMTGGYGIPGAG